LRTKRRKLKNKAAFTVFCLILLTLLASGCLLAKNIFFPANSVTGEPGEKVSLKDQRLNVLLLGIDARQGETMARTDTMILASVDTKSKQMILLSIPRDTGVEIPGHGWDKINSAAVYGGPELSMKVVSNLLGIPVRYYVLTNFSGFKDIVDALGGVTLEVEQNMYHEGDEEYGGAYGINLKKGVQRLDGDKALQYVRYREYPMGDIDRTRAQQKFLVALAKEVLQPSTIPKLPKLIPEISRYVKTNLSVSEMYKLAAAAKNLENGNILTQTLPGRPVEIGGISYWGVEPAEARQMVAKLFNGETVTNVVLTTPLSSQYLGEGESSHARQETGEERPDGARQTAGSQTQQGQGGTRQPARQGSGGSGTPAGSGQGTQSGSGSGGTGGTVVITPLDGSSSSGTGTGAAPGKLPGGEQTGTGTDRPDRSGPPAGSAPDSGGFNPSIPGTRTIKTAS